ncbi:MAG TPA: arginine biosynthesis protein ArgJ [Rhodopirellula sp.]|nr:MAG: bifunctional ornithine acetyltransferase/N-acetylglutamate synthase [Saprospirales bacterium TMED214]HBV64202.1 arginine biosynthesis protein ArgJ [Rhodopirellula sp.]
MTGSENVPQSEKSDNANSSQDDRPQDPLPQDPLPRGFRFAGVTCGIKPSGNPDLSLIVSDQPVVAAGVYTQNQVVAAPVILSRNRTPSETIRAVVTNSGNANACTGDQGMQDATEMCKLVAETVGCQPENVLVMSTGIIGQHLPMDCIRNGIRDAHQQIDPTLAGFLRSAEAIRTTDKTRKTVTAQIDVGQRRFRVAAMAKGAGMIAPNMATMLSCMLTDAPLTADMAQQSLRQAAKNSFNRVSVDGHTSTNDTLLLMSSGQGTSLNASELQIFQQELTKVAIKLAKQLVADGEGALHVMAIRIEGAEDEAAAETIARTVAASPLVKTAVTGSDPNWGRIVSAAGYANAQISPEKTSLQICGITIYRDGAPVPFDEPALSEKMKSSPEVPIVLRVGQGSGTVEYWSSDLTTSYVEFNSEYTT